MGALNDREFQAYRRIAPGRTVPNDNANLNARQHQEYALAIVGDAGGPVPIDTTGPLLDVLNLLLLEVRALRMGMIEQGTCTEVRLGEVSLEDVA